MEERTPEVERWRLRITGKVQGVYYRANARAKARSLYLTGWIRNEPDGSVLCEVQGPRQQLEQFLKWAWEGPPRAQVKHIEKASVPPVKGETDFRIVG